MEIITKKVNERICFDCKGTGEDLMKDIKLMSPENSQCSICEGTGKIKENHYYHIDEKNKICMDSDTLS
ncbi:unnamed protein product [marine sediment metagenome]|uniref:Uncharacterized protein n=1 Tax=marine sediment metagenome TaxID=412755 RepID=X0WY46_9ZZZZ